MTNNKHKPHRTPSWKRDTLLLTSLLRLRVHPPIPYSLIASTILSHFHDPIIRFYTRYACPSPSDPNFNEEALLLWLALWLEEKYVHAKKWLEECFLQAIGKEEVVVQQVLEVCGFLEGGFGVKAEREWRAQVGWLREGNWKAGSEGEGLGGGEWGVRETCGVVGECVPTLTALASDAKNGESVKVQKRESVNAELLERLRNLEVEEEQQTCTLASQPLVHTQSFLPALEPAQTNWGTTALNPRTPVFHPFQWTSEPTPAILNEPVTTTIFFDPHTGQILDFNQPEDSQATQEYFPPTQPEVLYVDPKKTSLAVRLQSRWNGFSEQLDEIKAMEEMLSQKQAAKRGAEACEGGTGGAWGLCFAGN